MISLSSKTGTYDGVSFMEKPESILERREPRVSKAKTLDGDVIFDFRGYATGDWEKNVKASITRTQSEAFKNLVENETFINLADKTGFYDGIVSRYDIDNGELDFDFWVRS